MNLTIEDVQNLIAFGNRATMQGKEADTWVELKQRLGAEGERLVNIKLDENKKAQLEAVPDAKPKLNG